MEISIAQFRNDMATPINKVAFGGERVVLTRRGAAAVVLVSIADAAALDKLQDREDADDIRVLMARRKEPNIPSKQIHAELRAKWRKDQVKLAAKPRPSPNGRHAPRPPKEKD